MTPRNILILLLTFFASVLTAQNKKTIFYDSLGQLTSFEGHWAQVVTGRYKSIYHKSENKKTLVRSTREEFESELRKTEKRITKKYNLGTDFPAFNVLDLKGNSLTKAQSNGKVIVLNFWFIGCAPCEMERPSLNSLVKEYEGNTDVVFISFAKNDKEQLTMFLENYPVLYNVVPTDKDLIETQFEINAYPVNIIVGRDGKYFYNSEGSGVGIMTILQNQINKALTEL